MKKYTNFWVVTFLAISLAFPIYSMGDMKLNLMTYDGYPLTSNTPSIKSFFVDPDNNLTVILQDPLIFQNVYPQIVVSPLPENGNCTVSNPWNGSVTAQAAASGPKTIGFTVRTPTENALMSSSGHILPEGATYTPSGNTGAFSWPVNPEDVGRYLAVFQAEISGGATSQIVVMIRVDPPEALTTPGTPTGPATGATNDMLTYNTTGATSSLGHTLEYRFNWGDGTFSGWSTAASAQKSWSSVGNYQVTVEARCQQHQDSTSVSSALSVGILVETISTPGTPSGTANGFTNSPYTYTTTGATSNIGHTLQYKFFWGDGTTSGWINSASAQKSWSAPGNYPVSVRARCQTHIGIGSELSAPLSVTMSIPTETISTPGTPSGTTSGVINTPYTYTTTGATSNLGHTVQYSFNWGDATSSAWSTATSAQKSWTAAGTYLVTVSARCVTDTGITSVSSALSVAITTTGGGLGSKTNPIPLNKVPQAGYLYPSNGGGTSGCQVSVSGKVYFMLDPSPSSMTWTRLTIKGYSNTTLKYWKQAQTKAGVDIGGEVSIYNSQGDGMDNEYNGTPYDFSTTRFLYAVEGSQAIDIFVQYWKF
jgi:hypothetical protein